MSQFTTLESHKSLWDYLGSRLNVPGGAAIPPLPDLIRCRGQPA